ncbi:non-ribosomal peptide synthetase [Streptomyces sp. SUK 48]|uniref:non-ribosomal peptide synthetase n=1 Tax=Streptomyces sp. SUK 48 TaxID=2582831 RepID=UPI00129BEC6F|nr:non-ribosomal peptide synthetase [Streptomyces sp. SUK 48]
MAHLLEELALSVLPGEPDTAALAELSFVRLGGDSLRAMHLVSLAEERLGVAVPLGRLLTDEPLRAVLARAQPASEPRAGARGPLAEPGRAEGQLSHAQQGMWLTERAVGGSPYNLVFAAFAEGPLRRDLLAGAVASVGRRHENLRTRFVDVDGRADRQVDDEFTVGIEELAYEAERDGGFEPFVRAAAAREGRAVFDLAAAPPLRFLYASAGSGRHALVLIAHHLLLDGWSVGLLLRELFAAYDHPDRPLAPAPRFRCLLDHQESLSASGVWDREGAFWEGHLAGVPAVLELPSDLRRPALQDPSGARVPFDLGAETSAGITARARECGVTPFACLLGAYALALGRHTGARRLLIGVPLAGRTTPELRELVAVTGNLVPVRIDLDDDRGIGDHLRAVQRSLALSLEHGSLPVDTLVTRLGMGGSTSRHPLVQFCFGMHDQLVPRRLATRELAVRIEELHGGGSQFDATLFVSDSDPSFAGSLEYATGALLPAEARAFLADFAEAVVRLARDPAREILEDVRALSAPQRARLDRLNRTGQPYPALTVEELFLAQVERRPSATAVREGEQALTYAELAEAAARQAARLHAAGVRPGDTVVIAVERSVAEIVAVLGALWAGAAYLGMDPALPASRVDQMFDRVKPAAVVARPGAGLGRLGEIGLPPVEPWPSGTGVPVVRPTGEGDPGRVAYLAFTSGSTGTPKGVRVPHRAVARLVHDAAYLRLGPGERMLRLAPLGFDASTLEIWGPLLSGATIEILPAGLPAPAEIGGFLRRRGVTVCWLTSGLFRLVADFAPDGFTGVRHVLTGGDVVPARQVAALLARHPHLLVSNGYGPTENTTFSTVHTVGRAEDVEDPLPIGVPVPRSRAHILDERGRLLPPGAAGELYVAGDGLALDYAGDPDGTAERFGHFSADVPERLYRTGDLVRLDARDRVRFLGRVDDQVKIRGFRIEPGEIAAALREHPGVRDAAVVVAEDGGVSRQLLAVCVPSDTASALSTAELGAFLDQRLPAYMVPGLWAIVDEIPVTANGKTDRARLAGLGRPAAEPAAPAGPDGRRPEVARFLCQVLEREDVGDDANFFDVGGNSTRAVRLVGLLRRELGVEVGLRDFLRAPTLSGLLRTLARTSGPATGPATGPTSGPAAGPTTGPAPGTAAG